MLQIRLGRFCSVPSLRGMATDPSIAGGRVGPPPPVTAPLQSVLDLRVPKELRKVVVRSERQAIPPGQVWEHYVGQVQSAAGDPGAIISAVAEYMKTEDNMDIRFLVTAVCELGSSFDFNSFWATGDKQILKDNYYFKCLISDLIEAQGQISPGQVPAILYSLACLEYRPARLMPGLVGLVRSHLKEWRLEVLSNLAYSLGTLNWDTAIVDELLAESVGRFAEFPELGDLHDWSQLAFISAMRGTYASTDLFLGKAVGHLKTTAQLDRSGWAQFFLYQTLYGADVEKPGNVHLIQQAVPMWVQERLHYRWLDGVVTTCQPQGIDLFQMDVDAVLKRTNTQSLINCSVGRESDDQHCWFAGHKLNPKIAWEYDSQLPIKQGEFRPSGWLEFKARVLRKCGYTVAVIHRGVWTKLNESQKDEQIHLLRAKLGYIHSEELEVKPVDQAVPKKRGERVTRLKDGAVKWEDQPDWKPHMREPELEFTVHGYKPKDNPNFKGGVRVNHRRKYIANGNHNWVNSLAPKG